MLISFKLFRPNDSDLAAFVRLLTDNGYSVKFERYGTKHLMARVAVSTPRTNDSSDTKRHCGDCKYNDNVCYTSNPPMYKCLITNQYHHYNDICNVDDTDVELYEKQHSSQYTTTESTVDISGSITGSV